MSKSQKFLVAIFLFAAFVVFSFFVQKRIFNAFDFDTTVRFQNHIDATFGQRRGFDTLLSVLSLLGSVEVVTVLLFLLLILKRNLGLFLLVPFSFLTIHIVEIFGKIFVRHPGPPFMFLRYDINFIFPSTYVKPGFSYPSGHAGRATFLSVILLYFIWRSRLSRNIKILASLIVLAFEMGMLVSRVYLGEHWTTDVIGGTLLGAALGLLTVTFI
ncbi:MAG TPA: phosphatase PAP2 family protein [Patescibacteria group bacterium]|nr:phosphatase PAP2 family protein [Patescibacteria group bacterium]